MDRFDTSKDPRFKRAPRHVRRVQVDGRFARMFKDKQFVETPKVDARGQPLRRNAGKQKLQEFYELAGVEGAEAMASMASTQDEDENDDELQEEDLEEEEDLDESEEEEEQIIEETVQEIPQGDATRRFAVMGCDWDHVSAGDLMVMFRTYLASARSKSQAGSVDKISIFPSDYGLQQLEREAKEGPLLDTARGLDENEEAQQEALRKYQMNRTKYYWALVECDSVSTASWLYDQMDGLEADGVCPASLDLRFVPDDLEPPHEPSSVATELPKKFAGPQMLRSAAGHTKVKCTWDEAPVQRRKDLMKKRFTPQEMAEMDLQAYLDSESDDAQEGAEDLKALVAGSDSEGFFEDGSEGEGEKSSKANKNDGDMEATFSVKAGMLEDKLSARAKEEGRGVHTLQQQPQSAWEKYLEKRKQKKRERKQKAKEDREKLKKMKDDDAKGLGPQDEDRPEELDLLMEDSKERGFNLRGPQRKAHDHGPNADDHNDHFKMNVNDSRISKVFNSADFEIDPTNPEFRKSEGMLEVLKEKRKRKGTKSSMSSASKKAQSNESNEKPTPEPVTKVSKASSATGLQIFASQKRSETAESEPKPSPSPATAGAQKRKKRKAT